MRVGMVDPTTLIGLGVNSQPRGQREVGGDPEFEKVFQRTLAPPREESPPSSEIEGPEESPANAPIAPLSQMDPQPQIILPSVEVEEMPLAEALAEVVPVLDPLQALDIQAVQVLEFAPGEGTALQGTMHPCTSPELEDEPELEGGDEVAPLNVPLQEPKPESPKAAPTPIEIRDEPAIRAKAQVLDHLEVIAAKQTKVKIEMNPLDLGPMTVQVSQEGKEIKTHVVVENPALRYALDRAQASLTAALSEAGMNLSQFSMEKGTPQEKHEFFYTSTKAFTEAKPTYTSTSGGLEIWA